MSDLNSLNPNLMLLDAGLEPLWQPQSLPSNLKRGADDFLEMQQDIEIYPDIKRLQIANNLGRQLLKASQNVGIDSINIERNYRASQAIAEGSGNCIAMSEVIGGLATASGVDDYLVGKWLFGHKSNGLVSDANSGLNIDGYSAISAGSTTPIETTTDYAESWNEALTSQQMILVKYPASIDNVRVPTEPENLRKTAKSIKSRIGGYIGPLAITQVATIANWRRRIGLRDHTLKNLITL